MKNVLEAGIVRYSYIYYLLGS